MTIKRTRGDTAPIVFTVTNAKTRAIVNLSGCSFKLTASRVENPVDVETQLFQLPGEIEFPGSGVVEFFMSPEQADNVGYFYYDVEMTDGHGKVHTLVKSSFIFEQDITK